MKKGQLTVFIVIGISILVITGIFLFAAGRTQVKPELGEGQELATVEAEIQSMVVQCLSQAAPPLVEQLAYHGGRFQPNGLYWNQTELAVYCTSKDSPDCRNTAPLRQEMEAELAEQVKLQLVSCIDLDPWKNKYEITAGEQALKVTIAPNEVNLLLDFPIFLKRGTDEKKMNEFSTSLALPLGRMYGLAVDITNREIEGFFDKDDWMVKHGMEIMIERHKPYPDTIYVLKKTVEFAGRKFDFQFNFAIKGRETFNDEVIKKGATLPCLITEDQLCYFNRQAGSAGKSQACTRCAEATLPIVEGCCVEGDGSCSFTQEAECTGKFTKGDMLCQSAPCPNLQCKKTESFQNSAKRHGESWCVYDALVGRGTDYVGSRQFLHSCLNGQEVVDECRDYREELCTDEIVPHKGEPYSKGVCRTNRWYDCAQQTSAEACTDKSQRDCSWFGSLWTPKKCHPVAKPGFRFWLGENAAVCSEANEESLGFPYPRSYGHSALLYCQRMGDCGHYRNIADVITKGGWSHPYDTNRLQSWVYWPAGLVHKGTDYFIDAGINNLDYNEDAVLPTSVSGGKIRCLPWRAPPQGDCTLCSADKNKPCSEYRCKSLGQNCRFSMEKGIPNCAGTTTQTPSITVTPSGVSPGFDYISQADSFCPGETTYTIAPNVTAHEEFTVDIRTNEETRCLATVIPPCLLLLQSSLLASPLSGLPDMVLSNGSYTTTHSLSLRLPSVDTVQFTPIGYYPLYIQCENKQGYEPAKLFSYSIPVNPPSLKGPTPISAEGGKGQPLTAFIDRPFDDCRWSFSQADYSTMNKLSCKAENLDVNFVTEPFGTYPCTETILLPPTVQTLYLQCSQNQTIGEMRSFSLV